MAGPDMNLIHCVAGLKGNQSYGTRFDNLAGWLS